MKVNEDFIKIFKQYEQKNSCISNNIQLQKVEIKRPFLFYLFYKKAKLEYGNLKEQVR